MLVMGNIEAVSEAQTKLLNYILLVSKSAFFVKA